MPKYIEEVIQEFEKKFCKPLLGYDLKFLTSEERASINQLKDFIQSALQKQLEMIEGEIENTRDIRIYLDGSEWCANRSDFQNLQESIAGFGVTPTSALIDLLRQEKQ